MSEDQESLLKNFDDPSSFQLDQKISGDVLEQHQRLIASYWPEITQKQEDFPNKTNLTSTHFKDAILFSEGIDISLWDLGPRLCIVATSQEMPQTPNITLVGGIWIKDPKTDGLIFNIGIDGKCPRPMSSELEIGRLRQQKNLQELLVDWASYKEERDNKANDEYLRLVNYSIDRSSSDEKWKNEKNIVNPLVYLTFQAMHHYLMKYGTLDEKQPLICWLYKNAVLPIKASIPIENC